MEQSADYQLIIWRVTNWWRFDPKDFLLQTETIRTRCCYLSIFCFLSKIHMKNRKRNLRYDEWSWYQSASRWQNRVINQPEYVPPDDSREGSGSGCFYRLQICRLSNNINYNNNINSKLSVTEASFYFSLPPWQNRSASIFIKDTKKLSES